MTKREESTETGSAGAKRAREVRAREYVELHCHSAFSLLDGASHPEELVDRAVELGYHALAITDHDELGGIVAFAQAGEGDALECIIGAEITVEGNGGVPHHLVLLAEDRTGYGNLSTMITRARMDCPRGRPSLPLDTVAAHAKGLFALTGCPRGLVPRRLRAGDIAGAREAAARLHEIFSGRLAIECWDHGLEEERALLAPLIEISRTLGVPWVVTNDVHYARRAGRIVHDVLSSLRHQRSLDEMGTRLRPNAEWRLQSPARMAKRWSHHPDGVKATLAIAERCAFRLHDLHPTLPAFPLPPGVSADEYLERLVAQGAAERWGTVNARQRAQLTHELALIKRLGLAGYFLIVWDIVRFANRAGVLCQGRGSAANSAVCFCIGITAVDPIKLNLLFERFLSDDRREAPDIDIDFAHRDREQVLQYVYERYGREHAAMVCEQITYRGRSAVRDACRVLGFSVEQADTLAAMSDRFSARATAEAMQVETDVAYDNEDRNGNAAHAERIGSHLVHGTEVVNRTRALEEKERTARESARAERRKETPRKETPRKETPRKETSWMDAHAEETHNERRNPNTAIRPTEPGTLLRRAGLDPDDARVRALPRIVQGMHNIPRHRSIHVGGFVLTAEPLSTIVPIEPASMENRTVIQWEKDDVEAMGLVKIDLLGLGMLTLIQDCLKYMRTDARAHDRPVDARLRGPGRVRRPVRGGHDRRVPGGEPRADEHAAAAQAALLLRSRRRGRADSAGPDPGRDGAPVSPAQSGRGRGDVPASLARAHPQAHARRSALSGAGDAGGDCRGGIHRRRGGHAAARDGTQAQPRAHGGHLQEDDRRDVARTATRRMWRSGFTTRSMRSRTTAFPNRTRRASRCSCTRARTSSTTTRRSSPRRF